MNNESGISLDIQTTFWTVIKAGRYKVIQNTVAWKCFYTAIQRGYVENEAPLSEVLWASH